MTRYIITRHFDDGTATAFISDSDQGTFTSDNYDQYTEALIGDVRDWTRENLVCPHGTRIDEIAKKLEAGKTVDVSDYV